MYSYQLKSNHLTPLSRVLLEKLTVVHVVKKLHDIMEPEGLLLCSQNTAPGPYPEPGECSSHSSTKFM